MATHDDPQTPESESESSSQFAEVRYSLPDLLREVNRDRASRSFAMEKLDQPSITTLFEQQQQRSGRDPAPRK
jgi:hypothetical protein